LDRAEVRSLFQKALSVAPEERARILDDPLITSSVREEVLALLQADQGAETFLRKTVAQEQPEVWGTGQRFGPFETVTLLGRGGMATVFKAERVDGELAQTVAIKVVDRGWLDPHALDRFRQERQILAGLMHSNIARLIDGGTRSDSIAYLVMEYVDGLPLDAYCDQHRLSIDERLGLFLPLCDAVDYAHQKLVVHRDLKPSNVLVTSSGEPKLLDFGIAKALGATAAVQTQTIVMTPAFTSPEQVRGEEATTATDVYGLGSVLYFVLTGRAPHPAAGASIEEVRRAVCETPPVPPSTLRPELKGDLENIVLKALHADPFRRYHSVRELAEDIQNYLVHRPVRATPDGWAYRTKRFVQRHAWATSTAALAGIAVMAATAVSLYEAHRAQQRFDQVRELASRFVFDFEGAIRDTPGTVAARRMVASTARQYLAELAADAGSDSGLQRELAESYYRLAGVEMAAGESGAAFGDLQKSIAVLTALKDDCCGSSAQRKLYFAAVTDLALYQRTARTPAEALASTSGAIEKERTWVRQAPEDAIASQVLASTLSVQGEILPLVGRLREARPVLEEAVERFDALLAKKPEDDALRYSAARARHRLAYVLGTLGDTAAALDAERRASAAADPLIDKRPGSTNWRDLGVVVKDSVASFLNQLGKQDASLRHQALLVEHEAYVLARRNAQDSPGDARLVQNAAVLAQNYGEMLTENGDPTDAILVLQEAETTYDRLVETDAAQTVTLRNRIDSRRAMAECLMKLERWRDAASVLAEGEEWARQRVEKSPDDLTAQSVQVKLIGDRVRVERKLGHLDVARQLCRQGLKSVAGLTIRNEGTKSVVTTSTASQWLLARDLLQEEARLLGVSERVQSQ
jgi:non-specific serine/threonine protein kinase/serine/threonine-protein kinase